MFGPGSDARVLVCTRPVDFRRGMDSLIAMVQHDFRQDPCSGVVYVFRSKRKDRCKILWFDETGMMLATKRLEEGVFSWPHEHDGAYRMRAAEFAALLSGSDWRRMQPRRRPIKPQVIIDAHA